MNARIRAARATLRTRRAQTRAASRIRRNGHATLTTHCVAAGLTVREARSVSGPLRNAARALGIVGREITVAVKWRANSRRTTPVTARLYTPAEVARAAARYAPKKAAYRTAAARIALAA